MSLKLSELQNGEFEIEPDRDSDIPYEMAWLIEIKDEIYQVLMVDRDKCEMLIKRVKIKTPEPSP